MRNPLPVDIMYTTKEIWCEKSTEILISMCPFWVKSAVMLTTYINTLTIPGQCELMRRDMWLKRALSLMPLFKGPPPIIVIEGDTGGSPACRQGFCSPQQPLLYQQTTKAHFHQQLSVTVMHYCAPPVKAYCCIIYSSLVYFRTS